MAASQEEKRMSSWMSNLIWPAPASEASYKVVDKTESRFSELGVHEEEDIDTLEGILLTCGNLAGIEFDDAVNDEVKVIEFKRLLKSVDFQVEVDHPVMKEEEEDRGVLCRLVSGLSEISQLSHIDIDSGDNADDGLPDASQTVPALFSPRGASRSLKIRMNRALSQLSDTEQARLDRLRREQIEELEHATKLGIKAFEFDSRTSPKTKAKATALPGRLKITTLEDDNSTRDDSTTLTRKSSLSSTTPTRRSLAPSISTTTQNTAIQAQERPMVIAADKVALAPSTTESKHEITDVSDQASPKSPSVRGLIQGYENQIKNAIRRAERNETALCCKPEDARALRRCAAAQELARRKAAVKRGAVAAPTFTNVSASPLTLVLRAECETPGADLQISLDQGKTWKQYQSDIVVSRTTTSTLENSARKIIVLALASKSGLLKSELTTAIFDAGPPRIVVHPSHPNELERIEHSVATLCSLCATNVVGPWSYAAYDENSKTSVFTLCTTCALAPLRALDPANKESIQDPSSGVEEMKSSEAVLSVAPALQIEHDHEEARRPSATVALDNGGHRLWLSENVFFFGNTAEIMPQSFPLLRSLAEIMKNHQSIAIRIEGHCNSTCGLECNGEKPCPNTMCHANFADKGGAITFSAARAEAVKRWVVHAGVDDDRITTLGLGGSRRIVDDTDAPEHHLNRRVEIHTV